MSSCTIDEYDGTISVVQSVWTAVQWRGGVSITRQISNSAIPHSRKKLVFKDHVFGTQAIWRAFCTITNFKILWNQFKNTRLADKFGRFWFLRYHGPCTVMSHFFLLCASLNIRPLHCTQKAEYVVSLCYVFQDALSLTWMTLFSKVAPLSSCIITWHYFRFILP